MLSIAMISKHEASTLEQALLSVKDYVDEIVIGIDEESKDGTRELAERLATKTVPIYLSEELEKKGPRNGGIDWGFSAARNLVLDACDPENWRLILDGHELVKYPENLRSVIEKAVSTKCDGVEIPVHFEPDQFGIPQLIYKQARLFDPSVRYKNPIHNVPMVQRTYSSEEFRIEHLKKQQAPESKQQRDVQRSSSTIEGLLKKVAESPQDPRSWFYLGNSYKENARYGEAVIAYEKYLAISTWKEERWHARVNMGTCHSYLKDREKAREQFVLALEEFPAMAEAYYYLGDLAYKQERYREAQVWLEKCIELDIPQCKLFVSPKIYRVDRYDLLSMVYNHLGWYGRAIEQAEKALKSADNPRIKKNIEFWRGYVRKYDGAYYSKIWKTKTGPSPLERERLDKIREALAGCNRILDVGSGPGWLKDCMGSVDYVGIDISEFARKEVEKRGGRAFNSLDELNGEMFDGCVFGEILEHLEDDVGTLKQVRKHLKPGAIVIVSVPRFGTMFDPSHTRDYTVADLESLLRTLGTPEALDSVGPWMIYKCVIR